MPDLEETIQNEDQVTDEITDQETPTEVVPEKPEVANPYEMSPDLRTRYKSADDLEVFAKTKQSEADTLRTEFEDYKRLNPQAQPTQPVGPTSEELLDKLVKDPAGFVRDATNDIRAQLQLSEFTRTHPDIEQYKAGMKEIVDRNPMILNDPDGLNMVYEYAKSRVGASMATQAAQIKSDEVNAINNTKKTDAFVEGSSTPKPTATPTITDGMSIAEMDKIFDEKGVGWISDEERRYYDEE